MTKITIEKAFKARCKDCCPDNDCDFVKCAIYRYTHSKKEMNAELSLNKYCKECLNGNKFEEACCSVSCPIYKIRTKKTK